MRRVNVRCHWLDNPMNVTLIGLRADESHFHRVNLRGQRHIYPVDLRGATPGSAGGAATPGSAGRVDTAGVAVRAETQGSAGSAETPGSAGSAETPGSAGG